MFTRFLMLLAVVGGLAFGAGPACGFGGALPAAKVCGCCSAGGAMECCKASPVPVSDGTPAALPLSTLELKQALAPLLVTLGLAPQSVVVAPSVRREIAAQGVAPSRLTLFCTRLI